MFAMLLFTVFSNLSAWGLFAITDYFIGASTLMSTAIIAECFAFPIGAYVVYKHLVDNAGEQSDSSPRFIMMCMLIWFVVGAALSGFIINYAEKTEIFQSLSATHENCMTFAFAFVIGFIVIVGLADLISYLMDRPETVIKNHF